MMKKSIEAIADDLKIGKDALKAIENEDLSRMPDEVFAKGFLRGFARAVNADEDRVIQDYLQRLHQFEHSIRSGQYIDRENDRFWRKLGLSLTVLLVIICLTVFVLSRNDDQIPESRTVSPPGSDTPGHEYTKTTNDEAQPEMIRLSIITVDETWIKIIIDKKKAREYTLKPGDKLEFEASDGYNLLVGNAAGIKLFANRIPIDIPAEKGKVVNIDIP